MIHVLAVVLLWLFPFRFSDKLSRLLYSSNMLVSPPPSPEWPTILEEKMLKFQLSALAR